MKNALKTGIGFGLTSGVITTLGLMVGLYSGTQSRLVILAGVLTIAIADACSDAVGIHISEESKDSLSQRHVWIATVTTFVTKFFIALMFVIPITFLSIHNAIIVSIGMGLSLLAVFSYFIARGRGDNPWHVILEHVSITVFVIIIAYYVPAYLQTILV